MSAATDIAWTSKDSRTERSPLFENAPFALVQCQRAGNIVGLNSTLQQLLGDRSRLDQSLCFGDLIHPDGRADATRLLAELFGRQRDSFQIESQTMGANIRQVRWTAWRVPGVNGAADSALILGEDVPRSQDAEQRLRQAERLEAVGRWPEAWLTTSTIY